jgi:hypothetical protein
MINISMKKRISRPQKRPPKQDGMAAILITMVTMVVVTLIVLGFALIARHEQTRTLNNQLNTQAFYAAESGVADARQVMLQALSSGKPVPGKDDCTQNTDNAAIYPTNYPIGPVVLNAEQGVSYSCLLVKPKPNSLKYRGIGQDSVVASLNSDSTITKLVLEWQPTSPPPGSPNNCPGNTDHSFKLVPNWNCGYGLMRVDLTQTSGNLTRNGLEGNTLSGFFEPVNHNAGGSVNFGNRGKPVLKAANCDEGSYGACRMSINGLNSKKFEIRFASLYQPSNIKITAYHNGVRAPLKGAQALVDVTGRANEVLRRIRVRVPLYGSSEGTPNYAISSNAGICKRFNVTPDFFEIPGNFPTGNPDNSNPMCTSHSYGTPQGGGYKP